MVDVVQFRGAENKTRVEINYAFPDTTLTYALKPNGFEGVLFCEIRFTAPGTDTVIDQWLTGGTSASSHPKHQHYFTGLRKITLEPGEWNASITVRDMVDTTRVLHSSFPVSVRGFGLRLDVSDIMFTLPRTAASPESFSRNGVDASPNPRAEMVGTDPSVSIYMECYNALVNGLDTVHLKYEILDYAQQEVMTSFAKLKGSSDGLVVREDIPAGVLSTGVYTLAVSVVSADRQTVLATTKKRFYILNPELPPENRALHTEEQRFTNSEWSTCTGTQLQEELEMCLVLATGIEKQTLEGLTDDRAKQRFLFRFWLERDPNPETPQNERLDEFRKMKERANAFYTPNSKLPGWRTDRGRVLMKYGVPTQIIQHVQDIDTKPYEEWFYQGMQGGVYFYFVDTNLLQNHRLVHSTMLGEVRNENWFSLYAKAFSPNPNPTESLQPSQR